MEKQHRNNLEIAATVGIVIALLSLLAGALLAPAGAVGGLVTVFIGLPIIGAILAVAGPVLSAILAIAGGVIAAILGILAPIIPVAIGGAIVVIAIEVVGALFWGLLWLILNALLLKNAGRRTMIIAATAFWALYPGLPLISGLIVLIIMLLWSKKQRRGI